MHNEPETPVDHALAVDEGEELLDETLLDPLVLRPDGYYWVASDSIQEFGPFESIELALADMRADEEDAPEPGETLEEAEGEIGIADWIDPETGDPAEGQSRPRLDEW